MNLRLLNDLAFADKLNANEALTESAKEVLNNYRGWMYTHPCSFGLVNGFIKEARQFSYDSGMMTILESVLKYVNENNISWKLASACEGINANNGAYNYIAKLGVDQVEKLLEMKESDVVNYIKSGALKNLQFIPEFRSICKEVYKKNAVLEERTVNYSLKNPISYVTTNENETWMCILGNTFHINEGKVVRENSTDADFNRMNSLLPNFTQVEEGLQYVWTPDFGTPFEFVISESGIKMTRGEQIDEMFDSTANFKSFCDKINVGLVNNAKNQLMSIAENLSFAYENYDNVVEVDCAKVLECADGQVMTIIEGVDNVALAINKSGNVGVGTYTYDYMNEALDQVQKIAGVNLHVSYENRINEDMKKADPDSYQSIKEQLEANKDAKIEMRRKKIEQLAESYKNDPEKIALLSIVSKELASLEK